METKKHAELKAIILSLQNNMHLIKPTITPLIELLKKQKLNGMLHGF
jgi:hypothetical protein